MTPFNRAICWLEVIGEFYLHDFVITQVEKDIFHGLIDKGL